jgi:hypothetical protein
MQIQALLRVIIYYLIIDVSLGIEQPTSNKWLEIEILGD